MQWYARKCKTSFQNFLFLHRRSSLQMKFFIHLWQKTSNFRNFTYSMKITLKSCWKCSQVGFDLIKMINNSYKYTSSNHTEITFWSNIMMNWGGRKREIISVWISIYSLDVHRTWSFLFFYLLNSYRWSQLLAL